MPEVLEGLEPGLSISEMIAILGETFGSHTTNVRFRTLCVRMINRALLEIQRSNTKSRCFRVIDAELTLTAGEADYNVRQPQGSGGFGWTNCVEISSIRLPGLNLATQPLISIDEYRARQDFLAESGVPFAVVLVDQFRLKVVPTPDQDYTGTGDYYQAIPFVSADTTRIEWPPGWDSVVLAGAEHFIAAIRRPDIASQRETAWLDAKASLRTNDLASSEVRPQRAVVTRALRSVRRFVSDRSQDLRRG